MYNVYKNTEYKELIIEYDEMMMMLFTLLFKLAKFGELSWFKVWCGEEEYDGIMILLLLLLFLELASESSGLLIDAVRWDLLWLLADACLACWCSLERIECLEGGPKASRNRSDSFNSAEIGTVFSWFY